MRLKLFGLGVILSLTGIISMLSCATEPVQVPAPESSQSLEPVPERHPDIQSIGARVVTDSNMLTNDVNVRVGLPGYPASVGGGWGGNVIFYLDVMPPTNPDEPATTAEGTYVESLIRSQLWEDLTPGKHIFSVQLVTPDGTPLDPYVTATIETTVPETASASPSLQNMFVQTLCALPYRPLKIPEQRQTEAEPCADINVSPETFNFNIVSKIGQENLPGEGHFIYYFDVTPPTKQGVPALTKEGTYVVTTDSYVTWAGVDSGKYEVWVQLVNNDSTPLDPPVVARAELIVPQDASRYYPGY
jgi:hypothetical protein